jgi:hypothetical protein
MAQANLLLVCSAGRVPTVAASSARPGEARLELAASGSGYGVSVVLVGPAEILATVVAGMAAALQGGERR